MLNRLSNATAIALISTISPAFAEVTPQQVWENIESSFANSGYEVTVGSKDDTGNALVLTDIVLNADLETSHSTVAIPKMTLQRAGDARVRTVTEGDMTTLTRVKVPDDEPFEIRSVISMPGNEILSSGTVEDMLHEFTYDGISFGWGFGEVMSGEAGKTPVTLTLDDVKGQYRYKQGDGIDLIYEMGAAGMGLDVNVTASDSEISAGNEEMSEDFKVSMQLQADGIDITGQTHMPANVASMADRLDLMLNAGLNGDAKMAIGPMTGAGSFEVTEDGTHESASATFSSGPGEAAYVVSKDGMSYEAVSGESDVEVIISNLPFPISYKTESSQVGMSFPVSKADDPQPFSFNFDIVGLTIADNIWDLIDPKMTLPRDPANLGIDLAGTALITHDLLDPALSEELAAMGEVPSAPGGATRDVDMPEAPFEPKTIEINQVKVQAVGVDADISGDLTMSAGMTPIGVLEGNISGLNELLEKLVAIGLIPQEQLIGAGMMISMFAKPAEDDPSTLKTMLEFKEGGSIFANGQQVK